MERAKLDEAVRKARREYHKKWRAANRDRVKEANTRYWQKRAAKLLTEGGADYAVAPDANP